MSGPEGLSCDSGERRPVRHGSDSGPCPSGTTVDKRRRFFRKKGVQRLVLLHSQLRP
jgi:hypothetical protein